MLRLTEGGCDLLIAYHHASQPLQLSPDRYDMWSLGHESLAAYAKADGHGQPLFRLGSGSEPAPLLAYAAGAYMGHVVEQIIRQLPVAPALETT